MDKSKRMTREQQIARDDEFPRTNEWGDRKAVCKRCHCVMKDCEPMGFGEFWHPTLNKEGKPHKCKNAGKRFYTSDTEIEPFLRKRERRILNRLDLRR